MIRRPPRSTLFPYTTPSDLVSATNFLPCCTVRGRGTLIERSFLSSISRSEEHTSELQSRPHLVCRLLLEKKKNISIRHVMRKEMKANTQKISTVFLNHMCQQ